MEEKEISIENRLKELRREHELSQEDLAGALGISRQSVNALEQGRSLPSLPLVVSMCNFFNAAFEDLFDFEREISQIHKDLDHNGNNIKIINDADEESVRREETTMDLEPWRPLREVSLRDAIDRLFEDSVITPGKVSPMPKINIKDKKDVVEVKAELPGVLEGDINVEISDNVMTISGEKKEEKEEKDEEKGYYYKESHSGSFSRSFTLPSEVLAEKASAEMENGILTISIPKIEPKKAQKVQVKTKKK